MNPQLAAILSRVTFRQPCPVDVVEDYLRIAGPNPHEDYLSLMREHDGFDGPLGKASYLGLWPLDESISGTEVSGTTEFAPGLLLFAGDGGDTAYAFDRQNPGWPIVAVSLTDLSRDQMQFVAATFTEFLRRMSSDEL
jgi:hypothetical protein